MKLTRYNKNAVIPHLQPRSAPLEQLERFFVPEREVISFNALQSWTSCAEFVGQALVLKAKLTTGRKVPDGVQVDPEIGEVVTLPEARELDFYYQGISKKKWYRIDFWRIVSQICGFFAECPQL